MKQTAKKLLSSVLVLAMVLSLLPAALVPTAQAAGGASSSGTNEFGFKTDVPDSFDPDDGAHPFGSQGSDDRVNLMPVREIGITEADGSNNYTRILDNMSTTLFSSSSGSDRFLYVNGVAYDPTGSGRDDHVFCYGPVQGNTNIISMQDRSYENGSAGQVYTRNLSASSGNEYAYSWMTEARPYNAEGYLPIAAGDFDGDGRETVVLLDPEYTKLCLREYNIKEGYGLDYLSYYDIGNNVSYSKGTLNTIQNLDSGSDKNKKARNTPSIHLAAGDLDGDGADELVVTVSLGDMYKEGGTWNRGSRVLVLERSGSGWSQKSSRQFDSVGSSKVLRSAASVVGDIDGDGTNEILTVGVGSNDHEDNDDYEFGDYYCILMKYSNGSLSQWGSCTLTRKTTDREKDTVEYMAPLSVGLVRFNGIGTTPYLFVRGEIYQYNGGTYDWYDASTGMMGSQKIVRQPIVGNFDGNNRGQEQVLFVMATGTGTPTIGCYYNSRSDGSLSLSSRTYSTSGSNAGRVALTAADADTNDGMVARFESKTYEFVDPEVMAVLLATPYFEDLYDEYENLGATGFGKATGTETAVSSGASNRAGAYVSFEQDISAFGLVDVASVEMETAYEYEWSNSVEMSTSYETSIEYEAGSGSNQVVMICTPVIVYHYSILGQNGSSLTPMDISVAQKPSYSIMPLEDYNEIAERLDKAIIDNSSVTGIEPGQPLSYPKSAMEIDCVSGTFATTGSTVTAGYGNAIVGQSIEQGEGTTVTQEYSHSIDAKAGGGVLGFKVGGSYGHSWASGTSVTNTSSVTRSGSVANIPAGNKDYSLTWQFATWDITIGEGKNQYTVPVMGYLVPEAHQPPSVPVDLTATPYTTSVTLDWQPGYASAVKYEIYRYIPDDTAKQYYPVGTVDGTATSFTCEGLNPATRYYFSIRAVGENGLCSRYANPVMVTTSSEQGLPQILTQPRDQSVPVGEKATFSTNAIPAASSGNIGYTWQSRENSRSPWTTIEGAESRSLTLSNVDEDMDGTQYRCMISELGGGENPSFVYTSTATLSVGKYGTATQLTLSSASGSADHTRENKNQVYREVDATVTVDGTTYTKYNNIYSRTSGTIPYVYRANTEACYLYDGTDLTPLTALGDWVTDEAGTVVAARAMEQETAEVFPSAEASESAECRVFTADVYSVTAADGEGGNTVSGPVAQTLYAYNSSYYPGTESGGRITLDSQPLTAADAVDSSTPAGTYYLSGSLRPVDSDIPVTEIADTGTTIPGTDENGNPITVPVYAAYNVYALFSDGSRIYEKDGTFFTKGESGYTAADGFCGTSGLYGLAAGSGADRTVSSMVQAGPVVTETKIFEEPYYTPVSGEPLTLTAAVTTVNNTPGSGRVTFQITNTATGAVTTLTDDTDSAGRASVTWTPSAAAVYSIKAVYSGSDTMQPSSSDTASYYALASETAVSCYEILLRGELLYGNSIVPSLRQWSSTGASTDVSSAVFKLYRHNGTEFQPVPSAWYQNYILTPGQYRADALVNDEVAAQRVFTVSKRPIIISAPQIGPISEGTPVDLKDYVDEIMVTEADGATEYPLADAFMELFTLSGVPAYPVSGKYDISVAYNSSGSDTAILNSFRAWYSPAFQKSILAVNAEAVDIRFSAGENGTVTGYELGDSTTAVITSPHSVSRGSTVLFVPSAATAGFAVSRWTIDGVTVTREAMDAGVFAKYGTVSVDGDNRLQVSGVRQSMEVKAEFSNVLHTLSFSGSDGGSVTAVQGSTALSSPSAVVEGSSVALTAAPDEGKAILCWNVSRGGGSPERQKNPDGTDYTGTTLTLDSMDADISVYVQFIYGQQFHVTYSAVDESGNSADGLVSIAAEGLDENGDAPKGSAVRLTADVRPGTAIQRWEVSTNGGDWEVRAESTPEFTIYSLQGHLRVRAVVRTSSASYTVSYGFQGGSPNGDGTDKAGTLTARTGGTEIASGSSCVAYSSLVFTYEEAEAYEFAGWNVTGAQGTASSDGTTHTYTISSLNADVSVTAAVQKKPRVSVDSRIGNGFVSVSYQLKGEPAEPSANGYVYAGTVAAVTASPNPGYVVESINGDTGVNNRANGEKSKAFTVNGNTVFTAVFTAKPILTIDLNDYGTVRADGTRDGGSFSIRSGSSYLDFGSDVTVTLSPDTGWEADSTADYTDGTGNTTDDRIFTISNVLQDRTVSPVWTAIPTAAVPHSVVDKAGDGTGLDGTLTMSVTRKGMRAYAFTTDEDGTDAVYRDSVVTFTAQPDTGYKVGKWIVNGAEQSAAPTLTISGTAARTVQVQFDPVGEAVTYGFDEGGYTDKASLSAVYLPNGSDTPDDFRSGSKPTADGIITFTVSDLADGYEVEGWYVNGVKQSRETGRTFDCDVTANVGAEVLVKIIRSSYTVRFTAVNGTVTAAAAGTAISSGDNVVGDTTVTFTAAPLSATGYTFDGWTVNGIPQDVTDSTLTITVAENTRVTAGYTLNQVTYTVTYGVIGENGTLTAAANGAAIDSGAEISAGSTVTFTAAPAEGYQAAGWYADADGSTPIAGTASEQNSYTIQSLTGGAEVYVAFEPIPTYTVTVAVTGLGSVTAGVNGAEAEIVSGSLTVSRHDSVVLTARPDASQHLTEWMLDGESRGNGSMTLTLDDVTGNHAVTAAFAASQLVTLRTVCGENGTLTARAGYGGELTAIDATTGISIEKGKTVVLTVVPAGNHMVKAWTVNGVVQDNLSNTLTIASLNENTTVTVEFETPETLHSIPGSGTGYTVSGIVRNPEDYGGAYEIRDRGTVTFTVTPVSGNYLTKLAVNGTDCLTSAGTAGPENKLTAQANGDGSYTITVACVTKDIALTVESLEFQTVQKELTEVPEELADKFQSADALKTALRTQVKAADSNVTTGHMALFDIELQYTTDGGKTWIKAGADRFPASGITVFIPYTDLGNTDSSYTFTVIHMFTTDMNSHTIGDIERITPTKTDTGIRFTVTSLSPFAIGWSEYVAPSGGGGGGGGSAVSENVFIEDIAHGTVTADSTSVRQGDTVTLTVQPDKGYVLSKLSIVDRNGDNVRFTEKNGVYTFVMNSSRVTVTAVFTPDGTVPADNPFVDVPADAYYTDAVLWAAENGITGGTDATHFSPSNPCTRAQAVTFLWRAAGCPAPESSEMPFTDVAAGSYYEQAVLWAVENGITKGTTDTTFTPNAKCTRAQIVTFLWRSQGSPAAGTANPFTDVAAGAYYANAVLWAVENGITGGTTAATFSPNNDCTRAQIVTFLYRCLK